MSNFLYHSFDFCVSKWVGDTYLLMNKSSLECHLSNIRDLSGDERRLRLQIANDFVKLKSHMSTCSCEDNNQVGHFHLISTCVFAKSRSVFRYAVNC